MQRAKVPILNQFLKNLYISYQIIMTATTESKPEEAQPNYKILYYVPNIIGYIRIALICGTLPFCFSHPLIFAVSYFINAFLDGVDGVAARRLGQCSKFGMWLD